MPLLPKATATPATSNTRNTLYPPPHRTHMTSALMPRTTGAMSHPQPIDPAPSSEACPPLVQPLAKSKRRCSILPSAPGRPAAPATGTAHKATPPQKDADGKFPCAHCDKTYVHAKHLKRHLLRHTGDKPYMCVLCRDTFSRSDILKRHFQKCLKRYGNPQGISHLSYLNAHVKTQQAAAQKPLGEGGDLNHMNGIGNPMYPVKF